MGGVKELEEDGTERGAGVVEGGTTVGEVAGVGGCGGDGRRKGGGIAGVNGRSSPGGGPRYACGGGGGLGGGGGGGGLGWWVVVREALSGREEVEWGGGVG